MKIKRFYEQDAFLPVRDQQRVYYKLNVNNSITNFEIILTKLEIKRMFDRYNNFDLEKYRQKIENNVIVYLVIDFFDKNKGYNIQLVTDENQIDKNLNYGGEVFI